MRKAKRRATHPLMDDAAVAYLDNYLRERQRQQNATEAGQRRGSMPHRLRRQWMPHALTAVVLCLGAVAYLITVLSGQPVLVSSLVALLAFGGFGCAAAVGRKSIPAPRRRWFLACGLAAASWVTLAGVCGLTWEMLTLLLGGEYVLAGRWWRQNRPGYPAGKPVADVETEDGTRDSSSTPQRWQRHIAGNSGILAGSRLLDRETTDTGEAYTVQLVPGKQTLGDALTAMPKIASGLKRPPDELVIDRHGSGDPSRVRLQVITSSPIKNTVPLTKPRYTEGNLLLGPYADGHGDAAFRLYRKNSMYGGFVVGGMGSGKSSLLENIAVSARGTGMTHVWYLDPQEGASSPALAAHADWAITNPEESNDMLDALANVIRYRSKENAALGLNGFTPSSQRPGLLAIIDECHEVFTRTNAPLWAELARKARKVGVAILGASQIYGLDSFGGSDALRSSLTIGNIIVMRISSRTQPNLIPGLEVDPTALPEIPGYAYTVATQGQGRTAPFRGAHTDTAGELLAALPAAPLDRIAEAAAGPAFQDRHNAADASRHALREELAALVSGRPDAPPAKRAAAAAALFEFPVDVITAPQHRCASELATDAQQAVYAAITDGLRRPADIQFHTGYGETTVKNTLRELTESHVIARTGYGRYALTEPGAA